MQSNEGAQSGQGKVFWAELRFIKGSAALLKCDQPVNVRGVLQTYTWRSVGRKRTEGDGKKREAGGGGACLGAGGVSSCSRPKAGGNGLKKEHVRLP